MASLSREQGRESWKLSWYGADKKRKAIRLGAMPKKSAESFRVKFEELLGVRRGGGSLPNALSDWLDSLDKDLRNRLADAGLIERQEVRTLGGLLDAFQESRKSVAGATAVRDKQVIGLLLERFDRERPLDSITVREAEQWREWLATEGNKRDANRRSLDEATVRRRTGLARQIFNAAKRWGWLKVNPFDGLPTTVRENLERRVFVPWADVLRVIEQAPGEQWRAFIAFCRLIGPRVPSEICGLTWADVDFAAKRVVLRSPKTRHHGGEHVMRSCPIFPELVPYLQAWSDIAGPGMDVPLSSPVFPIATDATVNLRTRLTSFIVRAGLEPWGKLFVNLRSSRETELLARYPAADVCRWMGHSPAVAARFYAQARPEIAEQAAREMTVGAGAQAGTVASYSGAKMGPGNNRQGWTKNRNQEPETPEITGDLTGCEDTGRVPDGPRQWAVQNSNL